MDAEHTVEMVLIGVRRSGEVLRFRHGVRDMRSGMDQIGQHIEQGFIGAAWIEVDGETVVNLKSLDPNAD